MVLTLHMVASAPAFTEATRTLNQQIASLVDEMEKAGIRRADFGSGHYEVHETRQVHGAQTTHTGFNVMRRMRLELPVDFVLLDRFVAAVLASSARPDLSLTFTSRETGPLGRGAAASATADVRKQAEEMVRSAGLSLA